MKLYVWFDQYDVSYGSSVCFAIAKDEEEARRLIAQSKTRWYGGGFENESAGVKVKGPPSRVLDLPCAEHWYWQE